MKNIFIFIILLSIIFSGCSPTAKNEVINNTVNQNIETNNTESNNAIHTIITGEWEPYVSSSDGGGFTTEIISLALEKAGIEFEIKFMNWTRAYNLSEEGIYMGTYPWNLIEERNKSFYFSDPIVYNSEYLYYMKDNPNIPDTYVYLTDINNLKFGGISTYSHLEVFEKNGIDPDLAQNELEGIRKLIGGRVDLFPGNYYVMEILLSDEFPEFKDNIEYFETPIFIQPMGFMISKKYPNGEELMIRFNESLRELIKSGDVERIMNKYGYEFLLQKK